MSKRTASTAILLGAATFVAAASCGPKMNPLVPGDQDYVDPTDPHRARVTMVKNTSMPFVVDWKPESRGDLELQARQGPAIVRFDENSLDLLQDCEADGSYNYAGFTPKGEFKTLRSRAELHANLPLSAAQLEGRLKQSGMLSIAIRMVGKHELDRPSLKRSQLRGRCEGATHFVRRMTIGAFRFMTGASQEAAASAGALGYGAQGEAAGESETLQYDGVFPACDQAVVEGEHAPSNCSAILRIELVPLDQDVATAQTTQTPNCGEGLRWDGSGCVTLHRVEQEAQRQQQQASDPNQAGAPAPRGGFECDPANVQECVQQCKLGNLLSCVHTGGYLAAGSGGLPKDEARGLKLWEVACNANEAAGCTQLSIYYTQRQDWRLAMLWGMKGCMAGDPGSCTNIAVQAFYGRGCRENRPTAFKLWHRACKMRDFQACNNAGVVVLHGMGGVSADPTSARKLFEMSCSSPGKEGCGNLGACWEHGMGGPKDFQTAVKLYLSACNDTNNAVSCVNAGLLIEENSKKPEHRQQALALYEKGCAAGTSGGCLTTQEMRQYYPNAYSDEGYDRRSCEDAEQYALACYNAAIGHERGYGGSPDREKAKTYLDRACQEGNLKKACRAPRLGEPTSI